MLMDIACPAELIRVEQAIFGGGRRQAYFTFLNESSQVIAGLSGLCSFRDEQGIHVIKKRLTFDGLDGRPGRTFVCNLALDEYPPFKEADMVLESLLFDGGDTWEMNPTRLVDCTPPSLQDGPERAALIAQAGSDAVCFPEKRDMMWICVCGRFNRLRWLSCRRCSRFRDDVLGAFRSEEVLARHAERISEARDYEFALRRENAARYRLENARRRNAPEVKRDTRNGTANGYVPVRKGVSAPRIALFVLTVAFVVICVGWLLRRQMFSNMSNPISAPSGTMVPVDYLQPAGR